MRARCGHEPASGLYYEVLGDSSPARPPVVFLHGGGATGACFRATPDGRAGWADLLADHGCECWVTDWPGTGRSGGRSPLEIAYDDVVAAYRALVRDVIGGPVLIVCHSMSGAVTWQLVELLPGQIVGVVAVAASYPGNIAPTSEVVNDDGRVIEAVFGATGVRFRVDRERAEHYGDAYIHDQAIATSRRFPRELLERMRMGLVGLPPRMVVQRLGLDGGLPRVGDTSAFRGLPVRLVAGGEDPAHRRDVEEATVEVLRSWGADARLVWLPDIGIDGNGHFLFFEENSDDVLTVIEEQVREIVRASPHAPSHA